MLAVELLDGSDNDRRRGRLLIAVDGPTARGQDHLRRRTRTDDAGRRQRPCSAHRWTTSCCPGPPLRTRTDLARGPLRGLVRLLAVPARAGRPVPDGRQHRLRAGRLRSGAGRPVRIGLADRARRRGRHRRRQLHAAAGAARHLGGLDLARRRLERARRADRPARRYRRRAPSQAERYSGAYELYLTTSPRDAASLTIDNSNPRTPERT